jgi:apolipoprotein N-acyltransferase
MCGSRGNGAALDGSLRVTNAAFFRSGWPAAVLSGGLLYLCFPPVGWGFLIPLAPVPLLVALARRDLRLKRAAALGYVSHLIFYLLLLRWLLNLDPSALPHPEIRFPLWLLASAYLALYGAAFGSVVVALGRRWRASPLLFAPFVWVALEYLKGWGDLGFTWGQLCYALASYPVAIQVASLGGCPAVSLLVLIVGALLAAFLRTRRGSLLLVAGCTAAAALGFGALRLQGHDRGPSLRVSVVQPDLAAYEKWDSNRRERNLNILARLTAQADGNDPDMIVWPETAALVDLTVHSYGTERVRKLARRSRTYLLAGFPRLHEGTARNSAALLSPDGDILDLYDKIHPVPFSERMPLGPVFSWVNRANLGQSDFAAGSRATVFRLAQSDFGVLICFESTFRELARRLVRDGADFLVVITNDAWFGKGAGSAEQHAWMSVLRAVETGRPVVRCGNTGISMFIDSRGRVLGALPPWREGVLTEDIEVSPNRTLYLSWGDWVTYLCLAVIGALLLAGTIRGVVHASAYES